MPITYHLSRFTSDLVEEIETDVPTGDYCHDAFPLELLIAQSRDAQSGGALNHKMILSRDSHHVASNGVLVDQNYAIGQFLNVRKSDRAGFDVARAAVGDSFLFCDLNNAPGFECRRHRRRC